MKKSLPYLIALIVFVVALSALSGQKEQTISVAIVAQDMPAGHTLTEADLLIAERLESTVPAGAVTDITALVGETLSVPRSAGDVILRSHLGGETHPLAPDEREVGMTVNDAGGLAGLLKAGDLVGVTAVLRTSEGTYAKVVAEGLRVIAISPEFQALDPLAYQQNPYDTENADTGFTSPPPSRETEGVVTLAVPIYSQVVAYDFEPFGVPTEARLVHLLELLPALDQSSDVEFSLFLMPKDALAFKSPGIFIPDLVITPGPSPTPSPTPYGGVPASTPTP